MRTSLYSGVIEVEENGLPCPVCVFPVCSNGVPVVMAPQALYGRIDMNVYAAGVLSKEAGVIGNFADWLPEVAFAKLCWVLGHTKDMKKIEGMMLENIAGEISGRSVLL